MKFYKPEQYVSKLEVIYEAVRARLIAILTDCDIEHIGSSSIKGAISKGDLDILVRVEPQDLELTIKKIERLGFKIKVGSLRTESLCMLTTEEFKEDVAIQVIARGSEFENFVQFRDHLNKDPRLVEVYNILKINCEGISAEEYRAKKSEFIKLVLDK